MRAALELFGELGFDNTTVAEIADRAGLSERTFFRYFADKRDVLFAGSASLQEILVEAVEATPAATLPMPTIISALEVVASVVFEDAREAVRQRQTIISAHPELQERELIKLAALAAALAGALRRRGVGEPTATLASESGITVFKVAFETWVREGNGATFAHLIRRLYEDMKLALGEPGRSTART